MLERLKNLAIPLPEDIQKQEDAGYFAAAQDLIDKGYAYRAENGDVYFRAKKFKEYGTLPHESIR